MKLVIDDVKNIISEADALGDVDGLKNDIPLVEQGVDSLDMANIYLMLEEKYNITIPHEEASRLQSIDDILNYMNK